MLVRRLIILWILAGLADPAAGAELRSFSFLPQWLPQAQFAGYYMAQEKGFYRKHGINLTILRGGPERPALEALSRGEVDFATAFLSTAVQQRDRGVRLVNIGQVVQRSGFILVTKRESGIHSPADLKGRKVGLWSDFRLQPLAFFRKYGVEVQPVEQGASMTLFLRNGVVAASAMWYNEYHTLLNSGIDPDELKPFFFDQHGLNFPEDGIYCLEETFRRNADLCRGFVRASFQGWEYAFANPEETLDVVMERIRKANVGTNRIHQRWMLARMKDLIFPPERPVSRGTLKGEDYQLVAAELQRNGLIRGVPPFGAIHADFTATP